MKQLVVAVMAVGLMASPVWADSIHIGNTTNNTTNNQGGQGGTGIGIGGSASQYQGQQQGQHQSQGQGQSQVGVNVQGQKQSANNAGNSQSIKVESSMIPGVAVAPGLAAGGSQVCLGSFSVGLSGPMAGVAFGKTVQDKGCEKRQLFILLFNTGDARAKVVLDSLYEESMGTGEKAAQAATRNVETQVSGVETGAVQGN